MKSYQQFLAELKRRHVFKVAGIYGVVSFGVLQAADIMLPRLGLPDWTVTFMVALVVLAFPVALILAWAFEVTTDGVKRTDAPEPGELETIVAAPASQRWPAGLLALAGVAALVAGAWWVGRQGAPAADAVAGGERARLAYTQRGDDVRPSLAVLPFADMSPESDQGYFSDGVTEEVVNTLAKIREIRVAARTSAFAFRGRDLDMRAIGDSLDVGYLIEGSVRKAGDRLRITAQLIDAEDGSHLWSESYDRTMDDVFAIQSEIAQAIAGQLRVPLGLDDPSGLVNPTADIAAYDLYLAGRSQMRRRGLGLVEAKALFEAAIARDSTWAPAWAALAEVMEVRVWYAEALGASADDREAVARTLDAAETAARRALELDPRTASAYVALGSVLRDRGQWEEAESSYLRALELDPDLAEAHMQYSELLHTRGRIREAVVEADRAAGLDPAPVRFLDLAWALLADGRGPEAFEVFRTGGERDTDGSRPDLWAYAGDEALTDGDLELARQMYRRAAQGGSVLGYSWIREDVLPPTGAEIDAYVNGVAARNLEGIPPRMRRSLRPDHWLLLGEPDSAVASMLWISGYGPPGNVAFEVWSPRMDSLRTNNPRLREFLATQGLEDAPARRTPPSERRRPAVLGGTP